MITLSNQQQNAVNHSGSPALVVAGAGSGKTRTLTAKILHLIDQGYNPKNILAITFTNKAADEMKNRLYSLTTMTDSNFPWVRTYHSACLMIFKQHCAILGYLTPIQICSVYQQTKLMTEVLVGNNIDKKHAYNIISSISKAKNSGNPEKYFDKRPVISGIRIFEVFKKYENILKKTNSVDFDNILLKTRDILRDNKEIQNYYKNFFTHILVDEYQDTNNLQDELTRLLLGDHGNLFCVGDDWQAVYGFRGSNVNHFLRFSKRYNKAKIFKLEENYRSADEIVQVANKFIDYNIDKMEKKCFSKKSGGKLQIKNFYSDKEEAEWTSRRIKALNGKGVPFDKIAVIYRTKFCSLPFEKAFRLFKVPYKLMGSQGFFERMEILDINSYLSAAMFENDDVSFERIINTPKRGIGPSMIKKIGYLKPQGKSLQQSARAMLKERILTKKVHQNLSDLIELLDNIKTLKPHEAIDEVINKTQYYQYLEKKLKTQTEFITKKENLEQLRYTAINKDNLLKYLEEASLIREDKEDENDNPKNKVGLLTIHSSKGLEFEVVFVAGCEEALFPHWRSISSGQNALQEERSLYGADKFAKRFTYQ